MPFAERDVEREMFGQVGEFPRGSHVDVDRRYDEARARALTELEHSFRAYRDASLKWEVTRIAVVFTMILGTVLWYAFGITVALCAAGAILGLIAEWRRLSDKRFHRLKAERCAQWNRDFCNANSVGVSPDGSPSIACAELLEKEREAYFRGWPFYFSKHPPITPY